MRTQVLVVGAGLSGLALTAKLKKAGKKVVLAESRDRVGGRILSYVHDSVVSSMSYDLGPSWYWPGQPHVEFLMQELGLQGYDQFSQGDGLLQPSAEVVQRLPHYSPMLGSRRIVGGMGALVEGLMDQIKIVKLQLKWHLVGVDHTSDDVLTVYFSTPEGEQEIQCRQLVLAMPPRLAAEVVFTPQLDNEQLQTFKQTSTWMAAQAKFLAVYDKPFWRELGLSGDLVSYTGPIQELHDASPEDSSQGALTGFIGWPANMREAQQQYLLSRIQAQLVKVFGHRAEQAIALHVEDWAKQLATTTNEMDLSGPNYHPIYNIPRRQLMAANERIVFIGAETANEYGGLIEGALSSAEWAFDILHNKH